MTILLVLYILLLAVNSYVVLFEFWNGYSKTGWFICGFIPIIQLLSLILVIQRIKEDEETGDFW